MPATLVCVAPQQVSAKKLAQDLDADSKKATVDVIVQFNSADSNKHIDKLLKIGGKLKNKFSAVRGGTFSIPVWSKIPNTLKL